MHILLLPSWYPANPSDVVGVFFRDQALALASRGHKVGVVAPMMHSVKKLIRRERGKTTKSIPEENDQGVITYRRDLWAVLPRIPYGNFFLWQQAADRLMEKYIQKQGVPDIVHAHSALFAGAVAAEWKSRLNIPVVLTEHSSAFARGVLQPWQLRLARKAASGADARIAVSPELGKLLSDILRDAAGDWLWIPNVVADRFQPGDRQPPGVSKPVRFLNLALMTENKCQQDLIEAFAKAFKRNWEYELWFGGDGPLKNRLEETAKSLGVKDQVRFLGRIPPANVPDLLRDVDVMVLSSHYETFGLVAAEALMCGTPVVATRCGGPECIVQDGDGLLVPVGDIDQLSNALARMGDLMPTINSTDIARRAWQRFSADAVGGQLEEVYAGLKTARNKRAATQ